MIYNFQYKNIFWRFFIIESNFITEYLEGLVAYDKVTAIAKLSKRFNLELEKATKLYNAWRREWCKGI